MTPPPITEDYYVILEVEQTAALKLIVSSYKRLALKLHPDRNRKHNATEAFQLLGRAYETLKDESKRQAYDRLYPTLTRGRPSPQNTQTPCPPPASTSQSGALREAAQIAAIQKSKQERSAQWRVKKNAFDSSIFELQRGIRRLEQEIKNLDSILAAEAATEAQKNSWGTWLLSPLYKKAVESVEEMAGKDRERQERRIEKDMKDRRLESKNAELKTAENHLRKAKEKASAADSEDDRKILAIQAAIWLRQSLERQAKEKAEEERMVKIWRQQREQREQREKQEKQEKQEWEAAEAVRKQQAEKRVAEQKRREEETRKWQKMEQDTNFDFTRESTLQARTSTCCHDGWWSKVQGRTACPNCYATRTYLLQCPGCTMKACPKCQAGIRRRMPRNAARTHRRAPQRARTPSPDFGYDYDW